jgi:hypothetical protein
MDLHSKYQWLANTSQWTPTLTGINDPPAAAAIASIVEHDCQDQESPTCGSGTLLVGGSVVTSTPHDRRLCQTLAITSTP